MPPRAVDQRGLGDDFAAGAPHRLDRFARRQAGGHDVLDHQHLRAGLEAKPRRSSNVPSRPLEEHRGLAQRAAHFMADDHAAHRRRDDDVDCAREDRRAACRRAPGPAVRRARRVHQHARALQIARAAQARRQDEMPFEQRVGGAEFGEDLSSSVMASQRRNRRAGSSPSTSGRNMRLRARKPAPIEPPNRGARVAVPSPNTSHRGEDETDWMGDRPGRGRADTCSGRAQAPQRQPGRPAHDALRRQRAAAATARDSAQAAMPRHRRSYRAASAT